MCLLFLKRFIHWARLVNCSHVLVKAGIRNTNKTHMQFVNALTSYKTL